MSLRRVAGNGRVGCASGMTVSGTQFVLTASVPRRRRPPEPRFSSLRRHVRSEATVQDSEGRNHQILPVVRAAPLQPRVLVPTTA